MNFKNQYKSPILYILLAIVVIVIDQVSKRIALLYNFFFPTNIFRIFHLPPIRNTGFTLDLINMHNPYIYYSICFCTLIFIGYLFYRIRTKYENENVIAEVLILSGGISNIIDRLYYGSVIDFIIFRVPLMHYFAIGNIADVAITIGVTIFILQSFFEFEKYK